MHEMTVAHGLLSILEDQAETYGIARTRVRLKIGRFRGVEARQLRAAFEALAEGALAEGAALDVDEVAALARCRACGAVWRAPDYRFECPAAPGRTRRFSRAVNSLSSFSTAIAPTSG